MRIKIVRTARTIFIGHDSKGNRVNGTSGHEFDVPSGLSQRDANYLLKIGLAERVEEKKEPPKKEVKETATRAKRTRATKASKK